MGQRRVADEVSQAARPDPPRPQMFMAIDLRAEFDARIVEVDHDQPVEPDPIIEIGEERIKRLWLADVDPRAPGMSGTRQNATRSGATPRTAMASTISRELIEVRPDSEPAARRVFQHDHRRVGLEIDLGKGELDGVPHALDPGRDRRLPDATRCARSRTGRGTRAPSGAHCASISMERRKKTSSGPARLTRYDAWIATGAMS